MKLIKQSENEHNWPRKAVKTVEARKRDLLIRIADWTRTKEEPAYDVEVYIGGVYNWKESKTFSVNQYGTKESAKHNAIEFVARQTTRLL